LFDHTTSPQDETWSINIYVSELKRSWTPMMMTARDQMILRIGRLFVGAGTEV
jgi:hypothetical protein